MTPMALLRIAAFMGALVSAGAASAGSPVYMHKETAATAINGTTCSSAVWSGWVGTSSARSIHWEIALTDANASVTGVTMVCETSDSKTTANDAGFELHVLTDSATPGTSTSIQHTWSNPMSAAEKWTWTISNLPHEYINCQFTCGGVPAAADTLLVKYRWSTP